MANQTLVFEGGVTLPRAAQTKAAMRHLRHMARIARLPWSGRHAVVNTRRGLRRAAGVGLEIGVPLPKRIRRCLIAGGMTVTEAAALQLVSQW